MTKILITNYEMKATHKYYC